jgi:hypothetical protein
MVFERVSAVDEVSELSLATDEEGSSVFFIKSDALHPAELIVHITADVMNASVFFVIWRFFISSPLSFNTRSPCFSLFLYAFIVKRVNEKTVKKS